MESESVKCPDCLHGIQYVAVDNPRLRASYVQYEEHLCTTCKGDWRHPPQAPA